MIRLFEKWKFCFIPALSPRGSVILLVPSTATRWRSVFLSAMGSRASTGVETNAWSRVFFSDLTTAWEYTRFYRIFWIALKMDNRGGIFQNIFNFTCLTFAPLVFLKVWYFLKLEAYLIISFPMIYSRSDHSFFHFCCFADHWTLWLTDRQTV